MGKLKITDQAIRQEIEHMRAAMNSKMTANTFICYHTAINALEWAMGRPGAIVPSQLAKFADDVSKKRRRSERK